MATTYTKRLRAYFFTTVGDTQTNGFWSRFVGGGVSKPSESTMSDLVASAAFHTEVSSAAQIDTVAALQDKQGLVIISSDASAKTGTNTALGFTGGKTSVQPSQLPTVESTTSDFTVTTVPADGANSATQDPFDLIADATSTRNRYILKFKATYVKWLLRRVLPAGGTTGQAIVKTTGTDFDYVWGTVASGGGDSYKTTSTTSTTLDNTAKTFTVAAGLAYAKGIRTRVTNSADNTQYLEGLVTSYSGTSLVFTPDVVMGTGTVASWNINLGGDIPQQIITGVANLYVSQLGGNDTTGDGSINKPYATISKGVTMTGNNQTVVIFAGSYNNSTNVVKTYTGAITRYTLYCFPGVVITQTANSFYDSTGAKCRVDIYGEPDIIQTGSLLYVFNVQQVAKLYIGTINCQQALDAYTYAYAPDGSTFANELQTISIKQIVFSNLSPDTTGMGIRLAGTNQGIPAPNNTLELTIKGMIFSGTAALNNVQFITIENPYSLVINNSYLYHGGSTTLTSPKFFTFKYLTSGTVGRNDASGTRVPAEVSISNTSIRLGGTGVTSATIIALGATVLQKNFFKNIAVSISTCTFISGSVANPVNAEDIYLFNGSTANSGGVTIGTAAPIAANTRVYTTLDSTAGSTGLATIKN